MGVQEEVQKKKVPGNGARDAPSLLSNFGRPKSYQSREKTGVGKEKVARRPPGNSGEKNWPQRYDLNSEKFQSVCCVGGKKMGKMKGGKKDSSGRFAKRGQTRREPSSTKRSIRSASRAFGRRCSAQWERINTQKKETAEESRLSE